MVEQGSALLAKLVGAGLALEVGSVRVGLGAIAGSESTGSAEGALVVTLLGSSPGSSSYRKLRSIP